MDRAATTIRLFVAACLFLQPVGAASADLDRSSIANVVSPIIRGSPDIDVNPTSLTADLVTGQIEDQTLTIYNVGASSLSFQITVEASPAARATMRRERHAALAHRAPSAAAAMAPSPSASDPYSTGAPLRSRTISPEAIDIANVRGGADLQLLIIHSGPDVSEIQNLLAAFPDIATVDAFDAQSSAPALDMLLDYAVVLAVGNFPFGDPVTLGNVLADYTDAGGGVVLTLPTFINGWQIQGRFLTEGYMPFDLGSGPIGFSELGTFDPTHPIMEGVAAATGDLLGAVTVSAGSERVAEWAIGQPFVATKGESVVAVNIFIGASGFWTGDIPLLLHNAALWTSGPTFVTVDPSEGTVPPGENVGVTVTFDATGLAGGTYEANLVVASDDPDEPTVTVPATLNVTGAPDITVDPLAIDFGLTFLGASSTRTVAVTNDGTDPLTVDVSTNHADYTVDVLSLVLYPGDESAVFVTFAPIVPGPSSASLTFTSNDPDEPSVVVSLTGEGIEPPVIAVSPPSMEEDLFTGDSASQELTIANNGVADLEWTITPVFGESRVIAASPVFASKAIVSKDEARDLVRPTSRSSDVYRLSWPGDVAVPSSGDERSTSRAIATPLEDVLAALNDSFEAVNGLIPNRFDFFEGETGDAIVDGGNDMYDGGNVLGTNLGGPLSYSDNAIAASTFLGDSGRYFTRKYPGLFVFAGDLDAVAEFLITGNLGADGAGSADGSILETTVNGVSYTGFVKRVFNAFDPSVNHLVIIESDAAVAHEFDTNTDNDFHRVFGLSSLDRIYYLLYAGSEGLYIDDAATLAIMEAFLGSADLTPPWLAVEPTAGTVPGGGSSNVTVTFDATGLFGGDYLANLQVASNDPVTPEVIVPTTLHVTGAPDITVDPLAIDFGLTFIGASPTHTVTVTNDGTDLLTVTDASTDHADYTVDVPSFALSPGESQAVIVTFAPSSPGPSAASLTFTSNDPDESAVVVSLTGEGIEPPVIAVSPPSMEEDLFTGESATQELTIANNGVADLEWAVTPVFGESRVIAASPVFASKGVAPKDDDERAGRGRSSQPVDLHRLSRPGAVDALSSEGMHSPRQRTNATPLEDVLSALNTNFEAVNGLIPNRFDFLEGETGNSIGDGGNDMYDGGNILGTNLGSPIAYSDNAIATSTFLGDSGRYFTRKYPGLFVFAGDLDAVAEFLITGNLGADGNGSVDGSILETTVAGVSYTGFVKRVFNAGDPSVNHLVIIESDAAVAHEFDTSTDNDFHRVFGLSSVDRIYYLLYAGSDGFYIDDTATLAIMEAFLGSADLTPPWLAVEPTAGTVPGGGSSNVTVTFDATGLFGGDYLANLQVASNDPVTPEVIVPTTLHVTGAPNISVDPLAIAFGLTFIGASPTHTVTVTNDGTDLLTVTDASTDHADYTVDVPSFALNPGESQAVVVTFSPSSPGPSSASLTFTSNDPNEPSVVVSLTGEGVEPPIIGFGPPQIAAVAPPGETRTKTLRIHNTGAADLEWDLSIAQQAIRSRGELSASMDEAASSSRGDRAPRERADLRGQNLRTEQNSQAAPGGYLPKTTGRSVSGGATVLIVQDVAPWGSNANETLLAGNGIAFDMIPASDLAATDLSDYRTLLVPSDQFTSTYQALAAAESQINDFVAAGGVLEFHAGFFGWNGGDGSFVTLPGGMGIVFGASSTNDVLEPGHPLMLGVPDPFFGSSASHTYFTSIPANALHIVQDDQGRTNLVEYAFGSGRVVTGGQTFEYGYANGESAGVILTNMIPYVHGLAPFWLHVSPDQGVVPAGQTVELEVTFDATNLDGGAYAAVISVDSNDPVTPVASVSAELYVVSVTAVNSAMNPGTINEPGSGEWIRAQIELPAEFDARNVILSSVSCMDTVPAVEDSAPSGSILKVKFDREAVQSLLPEQDQVEVVIMGEIKDTTWSNRTQWFLATPSVGVIRPTLVAPNGGEVLPGGSPFEITWGSPEGFPVDHADLFYAVDESSEWVPIALNVRGTSHVWRVPNVTSTTARARVVVVDAAGVYAVDTSDHVFELGVPTTGAPVVAALPASFALHQNAPNPFHSATEIRFDLPQSSDLALRIFDVSGRLVKVLADGHSMPGGAHAVPWDGTDGLGSRMAAGVYFYQLQAGDFHDTRRMIKLR